MGVKLAPPGPSNDYVYVPVPSDRVEDVYRFLLGLADADGAVDSDLERRVVRVYRESDKQFRRLLELLSGFPGQALSTEFVAQELELSRGTSALAGMLGAFGRRTKNRYGGFWPFERLHNGAEERSELIMNSEIATILGRVAELS
jgi:intein/homing endonuclease